MNRRSFLKRLAGAAGAVAAVPVVNALGKAKPEPFVPPSAEDFDYIEKEMDRCDLDDDDYGMGYVDIDLRSAHARELGRRMADDLDRKMMETVLRT